VAFSLVRPPATQTRQPRNDLFGNEGADVWISTPDAADPLNISRGVVDQTSWWAPQWSPDGRYLAMLSTRGSGGERIWIWVWERKTATLRRISDRCIEVANPYRAPFEWLDGSSLIVFALPDCAKDEAFASVDIAGARDRVTDGKGPTSSVIDGGVEVDSATRHRFDLLLIEVVEGSATVLANVHGSARVAFNPGEPPWSVSPGGRFIAYEDQLDAPIRAPGAAFWRSNAGPSAIHVVDRKSRRILS
jgi:hypothetical protein